MNMKSSSFTLCSESRLNVLKTPCSISVAYNPYELKAKNQPYPTPADYNAIWDTGATGSVISQRVVDELGLHPTGFIPVHHAGGCDLSPWYKVNIMLPNNVGFSEIKVTQAKLTSADVLIGMDIISLGDFSITNVNGKTTFSFRVPSLETIDYVKEQQKKQKVQQPVIAPKKVGRNNPCPCGSGKKYKHCCGK